MYDFGVGCHGEREVVVSDFHGGLHVLASRRGGRQGALGGDAKSRNRMNEEVGHESQVGGNDGQRAGTYT